MSSAAMLTAAPALADGPSSTAAPATSEVAFSPIAGPVSIRLTTPQVLFATALPENERSEPSSAAPPKEESPTTVFGLPQNMGPVDRVLRGVVAAGLIGLATYGVASDDFAPATSGVLYGVSAIPALTAITGYCPLYHALGIDRTF